MEIKKRNSIIIFGAFFLILILTGIIGHYYYLNQDYQLKFVFIVAKKKVSEKGRCHLFDKNEIELPLKSYMFYKSQIYEGDSIVKKPNSYFVKVYRKKIGAIIVVTLHILLLKKSI